MATENIPANTLRNLEDYVAHGVPQGDFLHAVLCNDLRESFGRADDFNGPALFDIVQYCRWKLPAICWGSRENVTAWIKAKAETREKQ